MRHWQSMRAVCWLGFFLTMVGPAMLAADRNGENDAADEKSNLRLTLLEERQKWQVLDMTPDGSRLLCRTFRRAVETYRIQLFGRSSSKPSTGNFLLVVDRKTLEEVGRLPLDTYPRYAYITADGDQVYFRSVNEKGNQIWTISADEVRPVADWIPEGRDAWWLQPTGEEHAVGYESNGQMLVKLNMEEQRVEKRVPAKSGKEGCDEWPRDFFLLVPREAQLLTYLSQIKCSQDVRRRSNALIRRIQDLQLTNTLSAPDDKWIQKVNFSPDGTLVAASVREIVKKKDIYSACVYNSKTGELLREFEVSGEHGLAFSPDNRILGQKLSEGEYPPYKVQARVVLLDYPTGRHLATLEFPREKQPRSDPWVGDIRKMLFTPDGEQLIVSTYNTRIWRVERTAEPVQ